jgi:hypothetical protein
VTNRRLTPSMATLTAAVALAWFSAACARRGDAPARQAAADSVVPTPAPPPPTNTRTTADLRITLDSITRGQEYSLGPGWPPILRATPGHVLALVHLTVTARRAGAAFVYRTLRLEGSDGVRYDTGIEQSDLCSGPPNVGQSCTLPIAVPARVQWKALWYGSERFDVLQPGR